MPRRKNTNDANDINKRDCWWRWHNDDSPDDIIIYTENIKIETKLEPMATYEQLATKKKKATGIFALQFKVKENSKEHKELFKMLGLTDKDEKKLPRKKRKTKAER